MSDIRTKPATTEYRDGWERIFGRKRPAAGEIRDALKNGRCACGARRLAEVGAYCSAPGCSEKYFRERTP